MTSIVESAEQSRRDNDTAEYLRKLLDAEEIGIDPDPATNERSKMIVGLCKQVIDSGEKSLSAKQKYVFENEVKNIYFNLKCEQCDHTIDLQVAWDDELGEVARRCQSCKFDDEKCWSKP